MRRARAPRARVGAATVSALLALAAVGCAREANPDLALACQVQSCVCRSENPPLFSSVRTTDVRWRENGDAYCAPGYVLRRAAD